MNIKKIPIILAAILLVTPTLVYGEESRVDEFRQLYDCSKKLTSISAGSIDYDLQFLEKDLLFILDRKNRELYIFTPYFAGKTDLEHDKSGKKINDDDAQIAANTISVTGSHEYNIRIPYLPDHGERGFYYTTVNDSTSTIYNEIHYVNGKPVATHFDPPKLEGWPSDPNIKHDARANFLNRFIPGDAQLMPDFRNYKPKLETNGITVTSVTGQKDSGVEYHSLDIEDRLWDKKAPQYSPAAINLLLANIETRIHNLPPEPKVGDSSGCPGAGCDWQYTKEMVTAEHNMRMDVLNTCRSVADMYHLDIFSSAKALNP